MLVVKACLYCNVYEVCMKWMFKKTKAVLHEVWNRQFLNVLLILRNLCSWFEAFLFCHYCPLSVFGFFTFCLVRPLDTRNSMKMPFSLRFILEARFVWDSYHSEPGIMIYFPACTGIPFYCSEMVLLYATLHTSIFLRIDMGIVIIVLF